MPMAHHSPCAKQEVSSLENYNKNDAKTEILMSEKEKQEEQEEQKKPVYEVMFPDEEEIAETCLKVCRGEIEIDVVI